ncbi:sideroflexin-4 [Discoglossus pictus]
MSLHSLLPEEAPSLFQRYLQWLDILDPSTLLLSNEEIKNSQAVLESCEQVTDDSLEDQKVKEAQRVCQATLHPHTGSIIPVIFRPPAFMPLCTPLAMATMLPHKGTIPAFFWQVLFQSYSAGFNLIHGNKISKAEDFQTQQYLFLLGSVTYTACVGATPQFLMNRYQMTSPAMQTFFRKLLPIPLLTFLSAFNVLIVRIPEIENGIDVMDKAGNIVGVSQRAGEKAVRETALSRAALIGVTSLMPTLVRRTLQRTRFILRNPRALAPIKHVAAALVFGLMIPVSFGLFPQHGKIQRADLEAKVQANTTETELFYHRGL